MSNFAYPVMMLPQLTTWYPIFSSPFRTFDKSFAKEYIVHSHWKDYFSSQSFRYLGFHNPDNESLSKVWLLTYQDMRQAGPGLYILIKIWRDEFQWWFIWFEQIIFVRNPVKVSSILQSCEDSFECSKSSPFVVISSALQSLYCWHNPNQ